MQVTGTLDTEGLERIVRYGDLIDIGSFGIKPLGLNTLSLTGSATDPGIKTIPLLVRIAGEVSARDDSGWFVVYDGSGRVDSMGNPGVKITISGMTPPSVGAYISVTGISSYESVGGQTYPVIKARNADDVQNSQ